MSMTVIAAVLRIEIVTSSTAKNIRNYDVGPNGVTQYWFIQNDKADETRNKVCNDVLNIPGTRLNHVVL